ncbi:MAG: hydrogenase 4 subunit B [Alphaproteobacteria bacterium]|nr:hydrogenase 4 subunit B [Alphaproteobacteria bacterium]
MTPVDFSLLCNAALLLLAPVAVAIAAARPAAWRAIYLVSLVLTFTMAGSSIAFALSGAPASSEIFPLGIPWIGAHFREDMLSAVFLAVVNLGAAGASFYAIGYGKHEAAPGRVLPFYPLFIAAMNLVILSDDAFSFLLSWEFMSLTSWALVMAHHRSETNRHAGYVYIVMASFGTLALLLAFGLLAGPEGNYAFETMRGTAPAAAIGWLVLLLVLLGAGSKAGIVPLHVWLPLAHPAAPSHVSALMSGVMTKVAIYAVIRIIFDLAGAPEWWHGMVVLVLGGITAAIGVLHALMEHDLKRLLAYHTIENIGIIFIGLGLAMAFQANGMGAAAALSLTAALFHVFNHSLFKSLLFFGSGAVLNATGERDMEHLGGLIHRMPQTAFAFLIGCAAISALPPLNGFVSEWMTFQAILLSPSLPQWGLRLAVPATGALLALSAALAAACFVKAFGVSFLGRARSPAAARANETDIWSRTAMLIWAGLCLLFGLFPALAIDALGPAVQSLLNSRLPAQAEIPWFLLVPIAGSRSSYDGLLVFMFITASVLLSVAVIHLLASRAVRRGPIWDCGFPNPTPLAQYSAGSFAQPIRRVFGTLVFRAREKVAMPPPGDMAPAHFDVDIHDLAWEKIYVPVAAGIEFTAGRLNGLQFLTIRRYLTLVFLALVALLLVLAIWT